MEHGDKETWRHGNVEHVHKNMVMNEDMDMDMKRRESD
jgi:hypothetical protein